MLQMLKLVIVKKKGKCVDDYVNSHWTQFDYFWLTTFIIKFYIKGYKTLINRRLMKHDQ